VMSIKSMNRKFSDHYVVLSSPLSYERICWLNTPSKGRYRQLSAGHPPYGNRQTVRGLASFVNLVFCGIPPTEPHHGSGGTLPEKDGGCRGQCLHPQERRI